MRPAGQASVALSADAPVVGGGDGGCVSRVGGADEVDSAGGVDDGLLGGALDRSAVTVGDGVLRLGCGVGVVDGLVSTGRSCVRGFGRRTTVGSSGAAPAPPPSSVRVGLGCCELTAAGLGAGTARAGPNWAPSHIAGPKPTATMAPNSASGPRSIALHPPGAMIPVAPGCLLPDFRRGKANIT